MASSSDQNYSLSGTGLWRRPVSSSDPRPPAGGPLRLDIDPPPKPRPVIQLLAFGLIVLFACLQFLPATHVRDPSDPSRSWIPVTPSSNSRASNEEQSNMIFKHDVEAEGIHIFSWTDCLDLRVLAVLANSTLSSSRVPEQVHFHFFVLEDENVKLSYYKLKVLLPHSNLDIIGQNEVKEKLRSVLPERELQWPIHSDLIPFIIPSINPSLRRFIYVSPDTMMKGNIEELFGIGLGPYAIAATENCSKRLGDYVNIEILNAIQRTAAESWVYDKPYDKNVCIPDFNVLLLDAKKLDKKLMEAILWWNKVLNLKEERSNQLSPGTVLATYNKYHKLPSAWEVGVSMLSKLKSETNVLRYDGPRRVCPEHSNQHQGSDIGNAWRQYLSPKSDAILAH